MSACLLLPTFLYGWCQWVDWQWGSEGQCGASNCRASFRDPDCYGYANIDADKHKA